MENRKLMKNELDNNWLDELREEMADYQAEIPADGWERLATSLPSSKRNFPIWMTTAVAAALLLILGFSTYRYLPIYETKDKPVQEEYFTDIQEKKPVKAETNSVKTETVEKNENPEKAERVATTKREVKQVVSQEAEREEKTGETLTIEEQPVEILHTEEKAVEEKPVEEKSVDEKPILPLEVDNKLLAMNEPSTKKQPKKDSRNGWTMGMRMGGNGNLNLSSGDYNGDIENLQSVQEDPVFNHFMNGNGFGGASDSTRTLAASPTTRAEHTTVQPVTRADNQVEKGVDRISDSENHRAWSVDFAIQKQLSKHLAIESGIVYSLLTSDVTIETTARSKYYQVLYLTKGTYTQKLHYLGVPLKINVSLGGQNGWQVYANAGGMLERCIAATRNGKKFKDNDWQWSVRGGAGIQYSITPQLSLFFEPGVAYYIDNHSKVPSFYTEHSLALNINAGIRINL